MYTYITTKNDYIIISKKAVVIIAASILALFFLNIATPTKSERVIIKAGEMASIDMYCTELTLIPIDDFLKNESGND